MPPLDYRTQNDLFSYKRVQITTVDTEAGVIDAIDPSRQTFRLYFQWFYDPLLSVPEVGEYWLITKLDNNWILHSRYESGDEAIPLSQMRPGDRRIENPGTLYINAGDIVMNYDAIKNFPGSSMELPLTLTSPENLDQELLAFRRVGEEYPELTIQHNVEQDGVIMNWGSGVGATDIKIFRSADETLTLQGNLVVTGTINGNIGSGGDQVFNVTNDEERLDFDARNTTIFEIADVLASLIRQLGMANGSTS